MRRDEPLVCFSHLRWTDAYQRPQHLLRRAGREREVYFVEEPIYDDVMPATITWYAAPGVTVVVPHLPIEMTPAQADSAQRRMIEDLLVELGERPVLWYYTPMALRFTPSVEAAAIVYDCLDEPALLEESVPELSPREAQLLAMADVVFTDRDDLTSHKLGSSRHPGLHRFPTGADETEATWDATWSSMWSLVEGQLRTRRRRLRDRRLVSSPAIAVSALLD